jgi:Domain of unknown function (DUF5615)
MAGLGIWLFTDEMIFPDLPADLRRRGYDAESCAEAGRSGQTISDEAQLAYATDHGRALLTFNKVDFLRLDRVWKAAGRPHAGIIVSPQIDDLGELLRRLMWHLDTYAPVGQYDTLLWLGPAPER